MSKRREKAKTSKFKEREMENCVYILINRERKRGREKNTKRVVIQTVREMKIAFNKDRKGERECDENGELYRQKWREKKSLS